MDGLIDSFNPSRPDILHAIAPEQGDIALLQPLYAKRIEPGHLPVQRTFFRDSTPSAGAHKDGVASLDAHSHALEGKGCRPAHPAQIPPYLDRASRHSSLRPRNGSSRRE